MVRRSRAGVMIKSSKIISLAFATLMDLNKDLSLKILRKDIPYEEIVGFLNKGLWLTCLCIMTECKSLAYISLGKKF